MKRVNALPSHRTHINEASIDKLALAVSVTLNGSQYDAIVIICEKQGRTKITGNTMNPPQKETGGL